MKSSLIVILEDIRSALNVGAIFRTCDAVGVSKLYLCGITPYPPHSRIPKTALGAIESVEWERVIDINILLERLEREGYEIISIELNDKAKNIYEYKFKEKTALIFGNEITGVSESSLKGSSSILEIPMHGIKNSLNVATSVGISAYEYIRQLKYHDD